MSDPMQDTITASAGTRTRFTMSAPAEVKYRLAVSIRLRPSKSDGVTNGMCPPKYSGCPDDGVLPVTMRPSRSSVVSRHLTGSGAVPPAAMATCSRAMTLLKSSEVFAQSTRSTRKGRSDSVNAARRSAICATVSGSSVISPRSRSEVSRAFQATRDPKARTSTAGTWSRRMSRTASRSAGRMSIGVTGYASEALGGGNARRRRNSPITETVSSARSAL